MASASVHVVDDDPQIRGAISRLLRAHDIPVAAYDSPSDFLRQQSEAGPGCLILDISMPEMDGLQLQSLLTKAGTSLAVVFVTGQGDIAASVKAMKGGAVDFLTKPFDEPQLLEVIELAMNKSRAFYESAQQVERCWKAFSSLTPRERQVCLSVSRGLLNKQVGGELGVHEKTIKLHRSNVMSKLGVTSLADLVRLVETLKAAGRLDVAKAAPAEYSSQTRSV